jgi:hypothetical protein
LEIAFKEIFGNYTLIHILEYARIDLINNPKDPLMIKLARPLMIKPKKQLKR